MDDNTLLFAVGRHIVTRRLDSCRMTFVQAAPAAVTQLTAISVSADRRHVLVCERYHPQVQGVAQPRVRVRVVHVHGKRTVATLNAAVEGQCVPRPLPACGPRLRD